MATHSQPAARHQLLGLSVNATSAWLRTQLGLPDLLDPTADIPDLEALRVLRAALRALFEVSMRGRPPPASALAAVNQASAGLATFPILAWSARTEPTVQAARARAAPLQPCSARLARSGIELLASPHRHQLHACQWPGCGSSFWPGDQSVAGGSTAVCGNRMRVGRHFRRHQQASIS